MRGGTALVELLFAAGLVLALDQASKRLVVARLGPDRRSSLGSRLRLRPITNENAGLGFGRDRRLLVSLWVLAALGTILLIYFAPAFQRQLARLGLGAALGGATGNLLDRFRLGGVVDFVDLGVWPVFNLADVGIVLGAAVALWSAH